MASDLDDFPVSLEAVEKADLGKLLVMMLQQLHSLQQQIDQLRRVLPLDYPGASALATTKSILDAITEGTDGEDAPDAS